MKKITLACLLIFTFSFSQTSNAQTNRFKAGIIAGLNFAELEGEEITDYFGINAGIMGTARLTKHLQLGVEILFSQNGEYILPEYYPQVRYGKIWLNHIEIPLHLDWLIRVFQKKDFYDWNLHLGIAYTKLLGFSAEDSSQNDITRQVIYEDTDVYLLQAGTTYYFTKNIGLNLKASLPIRIDGLSWTIAARMVYVLV